MNITKLPTTDSIEELADFWQTHDLTDFEDQLEEVSDRVFVRESDIKLHLNADEAEEVDRMAQSIGVTREELIRGWVLQKLTRPSPA